MYHALYLVGPCSKILCLLFVVFLLIIGDIRTRWSFTRIALFSTAFRGCRFFTINAGRARWITVYRGTLLHTILFLHLQFSFLHFSIYKYFCHTIEEFNQHCNRLTPIQLIIFFPNILSKIFRYVGNFFVFTQISVKAILILTFILILIRRKQSTFIFSTLRLCRA